MVQSKENAEHEEFQTFDDFPDIILARHYHLYFLINSLAHELLEENFPRPASLLNGNKNMFYDRVEWFLLARDKNHKEIFRWRPNLIPPTVEL